MHAFSRLLGDHGQQGEKPRAAAGGGGGGDCISEGITATGGSAPPGAEPVWQKHQQQPVFLEVALSSQSSCLVSMCRRRA